jgi:hypothetical protein
MIKGDDKQAIEYIINNAVQYREKMSAWENNFVDSVADQLERKGSLSERQVEILERIHEKLP